MLDLAKQFSWMNSRVSWQNYILWILQIFEHRFKKKIIKARPPMISGKERV